MGSLAAEGRELESFLALGSREEREATAAALGPLAALLTGLLQGSPQPSPGPPSLPSPPRPSPPTQGLRLSSFRPIVGQALLGLCRVLGGGARRGQGATDLRPPGWTAGGAGTPRPGFFL